MYCCLQRNSLECSSSSNEVMTTKHNTPKMTPKQLLHSIKANKNGGEQPKLSAVGFDVKSNEPA